MPYSAELETQYLAGKLLSRWKETYGHTELFLEINPLSKQFPLQCPPLPTQTYGFGELFVGIHYLNRGYEVIRHYWYKDATYNPYKIAVALMGSEVADYVSNQNKKPHTQPPDLLVYKKGRFFFVEVKKPRDWLKPPQQAFNLRLEKYLSKACLSKRTACAGEHWIHVVKLRPE